MEQPSAAAPQPTPSSPSTRRPLLQQLRANERHYFWKAGLRASQAILDLIGIGCLAYLTAVTIAGSSIYASYSLTSWTDYILLPFALAILSLSFIWCLLCLLTPLLRRSHRPVHPGTAVAFDLILWLCLIVTGLFTIASLYNLSYNSAKSTVRNFGYDYSSNYDGHYQLYPNNNTWVFKITHVDNTGNYHYNYTTGNYTYTTSPTNVHRSCSYFPSCAAQDAAVNAFWHTRSTRFGTEIVAAAVQWIGVVVHFALFVWACCDVHKRNSGLKEREMQGVADRMIRDMQRRGMITVHDPLLAGRVGGGEETTMSGGREMEEASRGGSGEARPSGGVREGV